jgi:fatty-acyl-CoA synthase
MDVNWIVDSPFEAIPLGDPEHVAVSIDGEELLTYRELRDRRNRFISVLDERGIGKGDRVGVILTNSLDYIALYFAIGRIGAIAVRVNFRLAASELGYILNDAGCAAVFFHTSRTPQLGPITESAGVGHWLAIVDGADPVPAWAEESPHETASAEDRELSRPASDAPLMIMYTSGTTGRPKGSVWTHGNTLWSITVQALAWSYTADTVAMSAGPLFHVGAFEAVVLPAMLTHGTAVILSSGGLTTERLLTALRESHTTNALLYPFMVYDLLRFQALRESDLASLRVVVCGGDSVQPWALEQMRERFPHIAVQQGYGNTEAGSMVSFLDHDAGLSHPDSAGRPFPLSQVRVVADGIEAPRGEIGEIWVRSAALSTGYWNNPEETARAFVDGWFRTGDLGRASKDGYLSVTGRLKDMIRSGGENIYPAEVEDVLARHTRVASIAVVAVPDERYIEVGAAVVVAKGGDAEGLEEELRSYSREHLAGYKCPRYYVFVEQLPMSASGKMLKRVMRDQYESLGTHAGQDPARTITISGSEK